MDTFERAVEQKLYLEVLHKYINLLLFGSISKPKFQNNRELAIDKDLVNFMHEIDKKGDIITSQLVYDFFFNFKLKFKNRLRKKDRINLMHCYGFSELRTYIKLQNVFNQIENSQKPPNFGDDSLIFETLLLNTASFPDEINLYLDIQFYDILNYIPFKMETISIEKYQGLISNFSVTYDNYKMLVNMQNLLDSSRKVN